MNEIWRDIEGYDGLYQVSNHGRVRSFKGKTPRILKFGAMSGKGYPCVCLTNPPARQRSCYVHRLVASAFLEADNERTYVNHKDGDVRNNHVSNLEWCTAAENSAHAHKVLGVVSVGSLPLFTHEQALEMASHRRNKISRDTLARELKVSRATITAYMKTYAPDTLNIRKLSDADVLEIQAMRERGMKLRAIGEYFGVSESMICRILKGNRRNRNQEQAS